MKQVFYLKDTDTVEFFNSDETECIVWVFRWSGKAGAQTAYSVDLHNLIEQNYFLN